MQVIAKIRRTIDGVTRKPGDEPFDLDDDLARELIDQDVVADANPPAPVAEVEAVVEYPIGYVGRQAVPGADVEAPIAEPVSFEIPPARPEEMAAPSGRKKGASRA